jgi:hypothetical protein
MREKDLEQPFVPLPHILPRLQKKENVKDPHAEQRTAGREDILKMIKKHITAKQAAEMSGVSKTRINHFIKKGVLTPIKIGRTVYLEFDQAYKVLIVFRENRILEIPKKKKPGPRKKRKVKKSYWFKTNEVKVRRWLK